MSKDFISISTSVNGSDHALFAAVVNKGIDSHLEAFTESKFFYDCGRFHFHFHQSEKHILLRRLTELLVSPDFDTETVDQWIDGLKNYDSLIED